MRTTLDIDAPVVRELKSLQQRTGKSLGSIVSELLARALAERSACGEETSWNWTARRMGASRVDLRDKEALRRALEDGPEGSRK
jgi:hypothetical protein